MLQPAIELAENGFPVYETLHDALSKHHLRFTELYPTTGQVYYRDGRVPEVGEVFRNPDFAEMLRMMCRAEDDARGKGRVAGIEAARDVFYKGEIADREAYYGDPLFDDVPLDMLLSGDYAASRRELIDTTASLEMRPGDAGSGVAAFDTLDVPGDNRRALGVAARVAGIVNMTEVHEGDTTHLDAVDSEGNMVAATPSGGWIGTSPVIPGLGFPLGTRGQMFYLNPDRPNALAPRKRPRATLTPSLVTRNGEPFMVFGTPGGDSQEQMTQQFFLNYTEFGMSIQEALDAPTVRSHHFPSSFYPRDAYPGRVMAESRIPREVLMELERRGHQIELDEEWRGGKVLAIHYDNDSRVISGGASPKGTIGYAIGW